MTDFHLSVDDPDLLEDHNANKQPVNLYKHVNVVKGKTLDEAIKNTQAVVKYLTVWEVEGSPFKINNNSWGWAIRRVKNP